MLQTFQIKVQEDSGSWERGLVQRSMSGELALQTVHKLGDS